MQARKVLIVDDDASVRKSLKRLVQSAGYDVEVFAGAREYLTQAAVGGHACLVLDVRMPEVSGLELMGMVAGTPLCRPVVLITGHGDEALRAQGLACGAVAVLDKPVEDTALLAAIERALDQ
jgi:two-component system response regulator FixJ